jgi:hypothetical protein
MPYTFERLPDAPIIIATWSGEFDYVCHMPPFIADLTALLDNEPSPVELIVNMGDPILTIADIFDCMKLTHEGTESVYFHSQVMSFCWVTHGVMLHQAAQEVAIPVYPDLENALEALRGRV